MDELRGSGTSRSGFIRQLLRQSGPVDELPSRPEALRLLAAEPPSVSLGHMALRFPPVSQFLERFRAVLRRRRHVWHQIQLLLGAFLIVLMRELALAAVFWSYALGIPLRSLIVRNLLKEAPSPLDASDALAVAICHINTSATHRRMGMKR